MADSYRLTVLKALTSLLEGINEVDGYNNTLGPGKVFRGRTLFGENDPRPMIAILESPRPDPGFHSNNGEARSEGWPILIQGFGVDDKLNPSDPLYGLLDDIERRLDRIVAMGRNGVEQYQEHYMLGRDAAGQTLIASFRAMPGTVRPPTEGVSAYAFCYVPVLIGLARVSS